MDERPANLATSDFVLGVILLGFVILVMAEMIHAIWSAL